MRNAVVIVFGSLVADEEKYGHYAAAGIARVREADSEIICRRTATSMASGYNEILSEALTYPDLEAVVLLHEDTEIVDADFAAKVRAALSDPSVGMIGVVGARDVRNLAYWRGELHGHVVETRGTVDGIRVAEDVDAIDGLMMIVSAATARHVAFDETTFTGFHGYDVDYSFSVRSSGARVRTADIEVLHHTKGGYGDVRAYLRASRAWRRKWLTEASPGVKLSAVAIDVRLAVNVLLRRLRLRRRSYPEFRTPGRDRAS